VGVEKNYGVSGYGGGGGLVVTDQGFCGEKKGGIARLLQSNGGSIYLNKLTNINPGPFGNKTVRVKT